MDNMDRYIDIDFLFEQLKDVIKEHITTKYNGCHVTSEHPYQKGGIDVIKAIMKKIEERP